MTSKPSEHPARGKSTGGKNCFRDFPRRTVVTKEYDSFLSEDRVDQHDDRMCISAIGRQMRMNEKRLRRGRVG